MLRLGSAAVCVLFSLFCVFGFLASGELDGGREVAWRTGYAIAGLAGMTVAFVLTRKGQ